MDILSEKRGKQSTEHVSCFHLNIYPASPELLSGSPVPILLSSGVCHFSCPSKGIIVGDHCWDLSRRLLINVVNVFTRQDRFKIRFLPDDQCQMKKVDQMLPFKSH